MTAPAPRAPVWHRLACEMAVEGYSLAEIVAEFGEPVHAVGTVVFDLLNDEDCRTAERAIRAHRDESIANAYRAGDATQDIADRFSVPRQHVSQIARRHGCRLRIESTPNGTLSEAERATRNAAIAKEYEAGVPIKRIADKHGIGWSAVPKIARAQGCEMRKRKPGGGA